MAGISIRAQATEAQLHYAGLRDRIDILRDQKRVSRPPEWFKRAEQRLEAALAASRTMALIAEREDEFRAWLAGQSDGVPAAVQRSDLFGA